ncbi:MAG: flagellar hook capping FlgD N-terminal domain-containing protein [Steroidobacteraceae bacterium]
MATTDQVNGTSGASSAAAAAKAAKTALGSGDFMTLMLTQVKNQDPFKPTDPTEYLSQLAQLSTVSGIQEMQESIASLSNSLRSNQVLSGTNLVGRDVLADAEEIKLGETGGATGAVTMPKNTLSAMVVVTDASGQLVRRVQVSNVEGEQSFTWDGNTDGGVRAAAGTYTVQAIANVGGKAEELTTSLVSKVGSVTIDPSTNNLILNTQQGQIPLASVRRVM